MDALERIKAFLRQLEEGTCDEVIPTTHGVALQAPSLSLVWQLNAVRVDDTAADAAALSAEAVRKAVQGLARVHPPQRAFQLRQPRLQRRQPREHRLHRRVLLRVEPRQLLRDRRERVLLVHAESSIRDCQAWSRPSSPAARRSAPAPRRVHRPSEPSSSASLASSGASRANTVSTVASFCA